MCILFIYNGSNDSESDYAVILISNRDEYYDRPSLVMAPWTEDNTVVGGRDLQPGCDGGTWLAFSAARKKAAILLNLPGKPKDDAKTRGKVVADYIKNVKSTNIYIEEMKEYFQKCNEFVFITLELNSSSPAIYSYSNATDEIIKHSEISIGFGNCLPQNPLKKVDAGKQIFQDICKRLNKITMKKELIEELLGILKSEESHLPDKQLETRRPDLFKELSCIFVSVPKGRYGTRTHTILLITKSGHADLIEHTMEEPIDPANPKWIKNEFHYNIAYSNRFQHVCNF